MVGCTSLGSFSARFTELVGETPSAYRARDHRALATIPACFADAAEPAAAGTEQVSEKRRGRVSGRLLRHGTHRDPLLPRRPRPGRRARVLPRRTRPRGPQRRRIRRHALADRRHADASPTSRSACCCPGGPAAPPSDVEAAIEMTRKGIMPGLIFVTRTSTRRSRSSAARASRSPGADRPAVRGARLRVRRPVRQPHPLHPAPEGLSALRPRSGFAAMRSPRARAHRRGRGAVRLARGLVGEARREPLGQIEPRPGRQHVGPQRAPATRPTRRPEMSRLVARSSRWPSGSRAGSTSSHMCRTTISASRCRRAGGQPAPAPNTQASSPPATSNGSRWLSKASSSPRSCSSPATCSSSGSYATPVSRPYAAAKTAERIAWLDQRGRRVPAQHLLGGTGGGGVGHLAVRRSRTAAQCPYDRRGAGPRGSGRIPRGKHGGQHRPGRAARQGVRGQVAEARS